jgi:hypothetical protein
MTPIEPVKSFSNFSFYLILDRRVYSRYSVLDRAKLFAKQRRIFSISATINAPESYYADTAAYALVTGELHIFGGYYDGYKVLFCLPA